ncbi:MAG: T9SS type A sorting domain-containing protein [Melioribacteraceae bacterium]|nr:T9SS type A sorting domain-containing protein [Melioribacteraceae bacterium]
MRKTISLFLFASLFFLFNQITAQWVKTSYIPQGSVESIAVNGTTVLVGSQSGGIYRFTDNGATWAEANNGLPSNTLDVSALVNEGSNFYAGIKYYGVYISTDNGSSWSEAVNGLPNSPYVTSIAVSGNKLFLGTLEGLYYSPDKGANWSITDTSLTDTDVRSLGIVGQDIFAGTYTDNLYKSPLNNINWTLSNNGFPAYTRAVRTVVGHSNKIFAATNMGTYSSDNGSSSWTASNTGMGNSIVSSLVVNENNIFAAIGSGDGGVMESTDNGSSWTFINDGFPQYPYTVVLAANSTTIFAGGPGGNSIWSRTLQVTEVEDENIGVPLKYSISQNYPNPFNPATTINYTLRESGIVKIKIYDILAKEIRTLVNKEQSSGSYQINFDASNLSSGVYLYELSVNDFHSIKKMNIIK